MLCRGITPVLLTFFVLTLAPLAWAQEEPTFLDKKLSYWLQLAEEGKTAKDRRRGVIALEQIGATASKKVAPALVKALREDKEPVVRAAAARAAGRTLARALETARLEKKDEPRIDTARDALATALRTEKDDTVREAAALGLGDLGPDARGAAGALALALKDKHAPTVKASAASLRRMGADAKEAQTELELLLANKKSDPDARTDAAIALGQIMPETTTAVPVLREVLGDTSDRNNLPVRKAAAEALAKLGKDGAAATPTLAEVLTAKDTPPEVRHAAVAALDQFGAEAKSAIPSLIKAVSDPALVKLMGDQARYIRCLAMHALGRMGKDLDSKRAEAVQALLSAVDDATTEVCVTALETLGTVAADGLGGENEAVLKKIDAVIAREGRKSVREAAEATLLKMKPAKKEK